MRRFLRRLRLRTIAGQVVLLVAVSVVLFHIAMTTALQLVRSDHDERRLRPDVERFIEFTRVLAGLPQSERGAVVAAMARAYPRLELTLRDAPERAVGEPADEGPGISDLRRRLEPELAVFVPDQPAEGRRMSRSPAGVTFQDGASVTGVLPLGGPNGPPASRLILGSIGFMVLNLALLL